MARRQLPLPDGIAPSRRAPPPLPADDDFPPPPVPSRPTPGRPTPSVPPAVPTSSRPSQPKPPAQKPPPEPVEEDMYDEGDVGEIYDEAGMGGPESEEEGETYDDAEIGEAADQQEEYADCQVEEEIEQPQESYDEFQGVAADDTYEVEEAQEEEIGLMYQECDIGGAVSEELYQIADDDALPPPAPAPPIAAAPALPPPRPKQKRDDAPPPPRNVEKKQPVPKPAGMGMPAIGMGDILNIKDRLKKVSVPQKEPEKKEPKQYTDHNELQAKFNFFKNKEREALAKGVKPDITPKPVGFGFKKSIPAKDDKTNSPVSPTGDRSLPQSRKSSDSLPPVPPQVKEIPSHHRDLPPTPSNATPGPPPPRGKDGYTKVSVNDAEENNNEDDDQEIYDDAISFEEPLLKERWYFGEIDRMVGNDKLKKVGVNGSFLLRKSTKGGNNQPYTLMVLYNDHIYNLKIRERNDGRMAIGEEKPDEMSFKSVEDLIKHHQSNDVILVHKDGKQDTTMLIRSPMK